MTENPPKTADGIGRRSMLKKGLFTGLGVTVLSVAAPTVALAVPRSASRTAKAAIATSSFTMQDHWYFCTKCKGIFWSGSDSSAGQCPAGTVDQIGHNPGSTEYYMPYGNASQAGLQVGWRYCTACSGLFWGPQESTSACPAAAVAPTVGPHREGGTIYDMMETGYFTGSTLQTAWHFCTVCKGLFWGGSSVCPKYWPNQNPHTAGGTNYCVYY